MVWPRLSRAAIHETRELAALAWPVVLAYVLQTTIALVAVAFCGNISDEALEAASLGQSFTTMTGVSVTYGFCTAIDTLCGQAFGAGRLKQVGLILQRAVFLLVLLCVPIMALWAWAESIFLLLHQEPRVAHLAGLYARYLIPGLLPQAAFDAFKKYLQAQGIVKPIMPIALVANGVNVFTCWFLMFHLEWGFIGAPIAASLASWTYLCGVLLVTRVKGYHKATWSAVRFSSFGLAQLLPVVRLGLPGVAMLCAEYWAFEICVIVAGMKSAEYMAVLTVSLHVLSLNFMIALGISVAVSTRCSNFLGGGSAAKARMTSYIAVGMGLVSSLITGSAILFGRKAIARVFTADTRLLRMTVAVLPLVALVQVADVAQGVMSGVLRGCGLQKTGATINLLAYYLLSIPMMLLLTFQLEVGDSVHGTWIALGCGQVVVCAVFATLVFVRMDWTKQARLARQRMNAPGTHGEVVYSELTPGDTPPHDTTCTPPTVAISKNGISLVSLSMDQ